MSRQRTSTASTPMSEAAINGNTAILEMSAESRAPMPNSQSADGQTALMVIARETISKPAKLLLDHGANVNASEQQKEQTALMWAAAESQGAMVKELVAHGADVNARSMVNDVAGALFRTASPRTGRQRRT